LVVLFIMYIYKKVSSVRIPNIYMTLILFTIH